MPLLNFAGLSMSYAGLSTSILAGLLAWADPVAGVNAAANSAQQGGRDLTLLGLAFLIANWAITYSPRIIAIIEKKVDQSQKIAALEQSLENMQHQVETNTAGLKATAEASGVNLPIHLIGPQSATK